MHPVPCNHCGSNFMRPTLDPEAPRLCNNCMVREEKRNPTKKENMDTTVEILIKCPRETQIEIEEYCINQGIDFTKYFLQLHQASKNVSINDATVVTREMFEDAPATAKKKSSKK
jgi:hypothetical protein